LIRKNAGTRLSSQKTNQGTKSRARKTPSALPWRTRKSVERGIGDAADGAEERDGREDRGEEDEHEAESVDAEVVIDVERGDPWLFLNELHARDCGVEAVEHAGAEREGREARNERESGERGVAQAAAEEEEQRGAEPGREDDEGEQRECGFHRAPPMTARTSRITKPRARARR
jgi:hypothetical protein